MAAPRTFFSILDFALHLSSPESSPTPRFRHRPYSGAGQVTDTNGDQYFYYIPYLTVAIFFLFGLLMDMLFLDDAVFSFDPNYDNWRRRIDPKF